MTRVLGIDGAPGGWAVVSVTADGAPEPHLVATVDLEPLLADGAVAAIDIPIGLPDRIEGPGRAPEQAIRPLLGARQSSVFSIPSRAAVFAPTYEAACAAALATSTPPRKVSRQAFQLFPKIREVDALHDRIDGDRLHECHAEIAFWHLAGGRPMATAKRVKGVPAAEGLRERIDLLAAHGIPPVLFERRPAGLPRVDAVDAAAIALIARRCARGEAVPFPDPPGRDGHGRRIAIWA